ncbi:MAG: glycosyltransferase family 9 protein [Desulfobulbus sp.]
MAQVWCRFFLTHRKKKKGGRRVVAVSLIEHLGDIVACEPVSRYLRQEEPEAYIVWFTSTPYKEIVAAFDCVDRVKTICCITTWSQLRNLRVFDRVVDLHIDMRVCPQCQIPSHNFDGDTSVTLKNYFQYGSILESFCCAAGIPPLTDQPVLQTSERVRLRVDSLGLEQPYLVIHCRSNELCKDWSADHWNRTVELVLAKGISVVEVGHRSNLRRTGSPYYRDFCGILSIMETAEVIRRAILFVGIDSGPAHMANAVGTYGLILLGRYRTFERYLPYSGGYADSSNAHIIYSEGGVNAITPCEVFREIERVLIDRKVLQVRIDKNRTRC